MQAARDEERRARRSSVPRRDLVKACMASSVSGSQQPIKIEQPDHAPGEIARRHGRGDDAGGRCGQI